MHIPTFRTPTMLIGGFAALVAGTTLTSSSSGVQSGLGGFPASCSSALPSCSLCHAGSTPSATGPQVAITTTGNRRALPQGAALTVTTTITGGIAGTTGGFVCETTAGTFTGDGTTNQVLTNPASVTHMNNSARAWTYTFTAPNTVGLVELTSVGQATNGSGTGGDQFAFSGYDRAAITATPTRLFVLPNGVTDFGSGCPDGFGNFPVLGANSAPTVGNSTFAFPLHGVQPGATAYLWVGINPAGFLGTSLDPQGATGCTSLLNSLVGTTMTLTSGSSTSTSETQRAEGTAAFGLAIPNSTSLHGFAFDVQGGVLDVSVQAFRSLPLTLTNGLHIVIP